jgi:hypothetical protein
MGTSPTPTHTLKRQGLKKGDCARCGVNLRPGYGYKVSRAEMPSVLLCVLCTEAVAGKALVAAFVAQEVDYA